MKHALHVVAMVVLRMSLVLSVLGEQVYNALALSGLIALNVGLRDRPRMMGGDT
jgi:hypothetical protein